MSSIVQGNNKIHWLVQGQICNQEPNYAVYVLSIELPLISLFCPPRKPINIINHINISKTKTKIHGHLEKC